MRVLLIGSTGQLGSDLKLALQKEGVELLAPARSVLDVCAAEEMCRIIVSCAPDVVINTSAFHKVEECEKAPERAFGVNAIAAKQLADVSRDVGSMLVHYSTDYVFGRDASRTEPYRETDNTGPVNVYGVSKVAGEYLIQYANSRHYIIRLSGLYGKAGSSGKGGNFVENMLKRAQTDGLLRVVDDQVLTPTPTHVVAKKTIELIKSGAYGLYHMTAEGQCSWYEFTREIMKQSGHPAQVIPVGTEFFPSSVCRPRYSVLSKEKLASVGIKMPAWDVALSEYFAMRQGSLSVASA